MHDLFDEQPAIAGLRYEEEFIAREEEAELIAWIHAQPLAAAKYKEYTARRRVLSFGGSYDFDANRLLPTRPIDAALFPLRDRIAVWANLPPEDIVHALVAEYAPGTPLGWHREVPDFESIIGVSLGTAARLRFRRYPPSPATNRQVLDLNAAPRSIYLMAGEARWGWQHSVPPVPKLRWSITFRTRRQGAGPGERRF